MEFSKIDEMIKQKEDKIAALKKEVNELKKKRKTQQQLRIITLLDSNNISYDDLVTRLNLKSVAEKNEVDKNDKESNT